MISQNNIRKKIQRENMGLLNKQLQCSYPENLSCKKFERTYKKKTIDNLIFLLSVLDYKQKANTSQVYQHPLLNFVKSN